MITVPRWFPDLDFRLHLHPVFDCCIAVLHQRYECRYFEIFQFRCGIVWWRRSFLWSLEFALFKREIR